MSVLSRFHSLFANLVSQDRIKQLTSLSSRGARAENGWMLWEMAKKNIKYGRIYNEILVVVIIMCVIEQEFIHC